MKQPERIYISKTATFECGCEQASRIGEDGDVEYVRKDLAEKMAKEYAEYKDDKIAEFCNTIGGDIIDAGIYPTIDDLFTEFINSRKA